MKIWKKSYQEIILFLCGNYGFLCFWESLSGIECRESLVCLWMILLVCGLWYFYDKKRIVQAAGAIMAGILIAVLVGGSILIKQAGLMLRSFTGMGGIATQDVTFLFMLVMSFVEVLLFFIEFIWEKHGIACLITLAMLIIGPMFGIVSSYRAVFFLALYQLSFFMLKFKKVTGIMTVIAFAAVFLLVSFNQEELYHSAYQAEHFVHNTIKYITGTADDAVADGHINRGNDYKTGTVQMVIETYELPTEPLYLCGFSGDRYVGGEWSRADDNKLLEQASKALGLRQRINTVSVMYGGMYYTLNSFLSGDGILNSRSVNIKHVSGKYRNYFEPYGGQWLSGTAYSIYYSYTGYDYRYYEQSDMKIDWNRVNTAFERQAKWYGNLQDAYMEEVGRECLDVPRQRLPKLIELCESYPLEDFYDITAFITAALESRAVYTQTPGNAPLNKDIVEYFLFESGKGYCQHFASAATLMYRLYGVPARYASGYMVAPSDFKLEKGVYKAYATDESAHAWVEVFIKDYGWVPIEVTPNTSGNIQPVYPGIDLSEWEQSLNKYRLDLDINLPSQADEEMQEIQDNLWDWNEINLEEYEVLIAILLTIVVYTIILLPFFVNTRRLKQMEKLNAMGCCDHFARLMRILHYAGFPANYYGTEEDFAKRLLEEFPDINIELLEIERMVSIVEKNAYGRPGALSRIEEAFVKELCRELSGRICNRLKGYRRLRVKYGK
ncbi:MAG: transglutaminase family protein [Lachnospiraceae bacterium]|nr:transglutaminase family protein [Lachnospiraceae bacterium]